MHPILSRVCFFDQVDKQTANISGKAFDEYVFGSCSVTDLCKRLSIFMQAFRADHTGFYQYVYWNIADN